MIHKDHIVPVLSDKLDRLCTASRLRQFKAIIFQEAHCHLPVNEVIVHNQHLISIHNKGVYLSRFLLLFILRLCQGTLVHDLLRNLNDKRCSLAIDALHTDRSLHQLYEPFRNGKSQSRSLDSPILFCVHLLKVLEDLLHILLTDAAARVLHPEGQYLHIRF